MRYWFIDSADFITLMLLDKGYYDYDFNEEALEKAKNRKKVDKKTREAAWKRMGFGAMQNSTEQKAEPISPEKLQELAMVQLAKEKQP